MFMTMHGMRDIIIIYTNKNGNWENEIIRGYATP